MRFRVEYRDVPPEAAGRRLGMTLADFNAKLPNLYARGFPRPDPDSGNFDLAAIDKWCDARPHLFGSGGMQARDATREEVRDRLANMGGSRGQE